MAKLKILKAELYHKEQHEKDIEDLSKHLRKQDKEELKALGYNNLKEVCERTLDVSDISFIVKTENNEPLCIFGVSIHETEYGRPVWLLGNEKLRRYKKEFLINSVVVIRQWVNQYGKLYNYIDCRNEKSIRWLKWLGANFSKPFPLGVNKEMFMLFTISRSEKNVR